MLNSYLQFAASDNDALAALGIDWKMLVFQVLGFLVLVWLMSKFVYPPLMAVIDRRQEQIEATNQAAKEAEAKAAATSDQIKKLLTEARQEATAIVATAKEEATTLASEVEARSQAEAERIVASATESISREVAAARRALHNETIDLVALATEKVTTKSVSQSVDQELIKSALATEKN